MQTLNAELQSHTTLFPTSSPAWLELPVLRILASDSIVYLPLPPESWDLRYVLPYQASRPFDFKKVLELEWLRTLVAFSKDPDSIFSTHMVAHNSITLVPGDPTFSSSPHGAQTYM